jgi:MFS family permease
MGVRRGMASREAQLRPSERRDPHFALLAASMTEAFFLFMMMGYGPVYLRLYWHAPVLLASEAAALPSLATFVGSTAWGYGLRRWGVRRVAVVGLTGYVATAAAILAASTPIAYVVGVTLCTLLSSALAPATLAYLVRGRGMGARLAERLQWQSAGWLVGGVLGGYLFGLGRPVFLALMAVLGLAAAGSLVTVVQAADPEPRSVDGPPAVSSRLLPALWVLVVIPFFFAYAGNEGFFVNLGLYLHGLHVDPEWVGWTAAISTTLGWLAAKPSGRLADRLGGATLLGAVLAVYVAGYGAMAVLPWPPFVIAVLGLPLYPLLTLGAQRAAAERAHGAAQAAALGILNGVGGLATFLGGTLMGGVEARFGTISAPWVAAGLVLAAFMVLLGGRLVGRPTSDEPVAGPGRPIQ